MKERPILFSAPMVRAILAGQKMQTRRVVKPQPMFNNLDQVADPYWINKPFGGLVLPERSDMPIHCPLGQSGGQLWVRETHFAWGRWETRYSETKRRDEWHFVDMTTECGKSYLYNADHPRPQPLAVMRDGGTTPKWWKRPAIFMPSAASRITLEVTGVRVERLNDISEVDCWAEGIEAVLNEFDEASQCEIANRLGYCIDDGKPLYAQLWESINGQGSWEANPWVWVIHFQRIT